MLRRMIGTSLLAAGALLLSGCGPAEDARVPGRWYTAEQVRLGARVFREHCASCHGDQAQGLYPDWRRRLPDGSFPPPPLNGSAHAWHHPLDSLRRTVREGGVPLGGRMPPFADELSAEEIDAVIAWFQSLWTDEIYQAWLQRGGLGR